MTIVISEVESFYSPDPQKPSRLVYRIDLGERYYEVSIRGTQLPRQTGMEAAVPQALLLAMRLGRPLRVKGALSATFLQGVRGVMALYQQHFEGYVAVEIEADSIYVPELTQSIRKAAFFSGGVDSFFTLFKARNQLTDIIYIHGFDVALNNLPRRKIVSSMCREVAAELGLNLIEVESSRGRVIQDFGEWAQHGHGLALASVARAFAGEIGEIRIPGSYSLAAQEPWGSWLETDPRFSDERLKIVHDACAANRTDKVVALSREPLALKYLRVCWESVDGMYNCCRCEKCLRTMVALYAVDMLDEAGAFKLPLSAGLVARVLLPNSKVRIFPEENLALMLKFKPHDKAMIAALRTQLDRPLWLSLMLIKWRKRRQRLHKHWLVLVGRIRPRT